MPETIRRIYVEKRPGFDLESVSLAREIKEYLGIRGVQNVRILNRYDLAGLTEKEFEKVKKGIFYEPPLDITYEALPVLKTATRVFAVEYLPGQYDMRADFAAQCVQIKTTGERPLVHWARVLILEGDITGDDFEKVKQYSINPVESREASLKLPESLIVGAPAPERVEILTGFCASDSKALQKWHDRLDLAMDLQDLTFCRDYFRHTEKRDPTITEIKVIDTYWSDHCRHKTFNTIIDAVHIEETALTAPAREAYREYLAGRKYVYGKSSPAPPLSLMDLATIYMKEKKKRKELGDLEVSEEINASSIIIKVPVDGVEEEWVIMFKNETHNHPTEIEPFGGASTCLGGCIRDPLSGRSYAYQAMRISGSGDPRAGLKSTLPGKLSQRKITTEAAKGFSSYGNQIGLATGQVVELYHDKYIAKRMEIGFVIGAAPRENVRRLSPSAHDVVLLLGGRTGRDGCGGATGSSREHDEESIKRGAEVQKGNAPEERKIQRLFRNPKATQLIKKANDFGAGGISVAAGELSAGLEVDLDAVPQKYAGLDGTELAISESQERMAVVVSPGDVDSLIGLAVKENLECTPIARVTSRKRFKMNWKGQTIVDLDRAFLDSGGMENHITVEISSPAGGDNYFETVAGAVKRSLPDIKRAWLTNLEDLNVCSQRGLVEMFDSTVGAGSVLMPLGGKHQETPAEGMAAGIPLLRGETDTATLVSFGFDPDLAEWSPFHGALYAVIEAAARSVAMGADYRTIRLTLQEYFPRLYRDTGRWGLPFSALLGALLGQKRLGIPAVGGKDSMSGTFNNLDIPPTVVAFAVNTIDSKKIVSAEFKKFSSKVILLKTPAENDGLPDFAVLRRNFDLILKLINSGVVLAANTVKKGGIAAVISKMCFGNQVGFQFNPYFFIHNPDNKNDPGSETAPVDQYKGLFNPAYGSIVLEIKEEADISLLFKDHSYRLLGQTIKKPSIFIDETEIPLDKALECWKKPLEQVFPTRFRTAGPYAGKPRSETFSPGKLHKNSSTCARPRVFIPVFPGTNCEFETGSAFEKAGAEVDLLVFRNLTPAMVSESISEMVRSIEEAQMIAIPGGFSAGDEPDGSAKFITAVLFNPRIQEAVMRLLKDREGLILGICNGFQALIKSGLVPCGEFRPQDENSPTLSFNRIERHLSRMVYTSITSALSPWLACTRPGDLHTVVVSHGEGRFTAGEEEIEALFQKGQVATQYVDIDGKPTYDALYNPNGSLDAVEGLTSPCGRVFGKMGHPERVGNQVGVNVPGNKDQHIFQAGVAYFR